MGESAWDLIQGVGALATAGALGFIIIQTISIRKQTKLLNNEMDYRLRPWLFPLDNGNTFQLLIKVWNEGLKKGLEVRVLKSFINEGKLPARSFTGFVTCSSNRIENYKSMATIYPGYSAFPKRDFMIEGYSFLEGVEIIDNSKFSYPIHIGFRIEYEYGTGNNPRKGFYQGHFGVKEIQFTGVADYKKYLPYIMDREDDFG